jgi:branched-chain amino acid transport system substrate-binding protein
MRSALWCCILVACICFGVATAATTVTFGQSAAFTGLNGQLGLEMRKVSTKFSGYPSAPACDTFVQGLLSAFKEVNDAGGIKGDLLFDLVSYDDAYEPANTTVNTERLISQDNVFGLIGYVGTATTQGMFIW